MVDALRRQLLGFLRVPPEPETPDGAPGSAIRFRAATNLYRWKLLVWAAGCTGLTVGLSLFLFAMSKALKRAPEWAHELFYAFLILVLATTFVSLVATFLALRLDYELHWYILTDRSLRIRRGVWTVQELTMTFANIQEIRIASGPLQNLLGIADVEVHSAGGGASAQAGHHGVRTRHVAAFAGVGNATEIRDRIVERLQHYRELGLGGAESHASHPDDPSALDAARQVLEEARSLRKAIEKKRNTTV